MAAGVLPAPGHEHGPCLEACQHLDCAASRRMAQERCRYCGEAIGFDTSFGSDPDRSEGLMHWACIIVEADAKAAIS